MVGKWVGDGLARAQISLVRRHRVDCQASFALVPVELRLIGSRRLDVQGPSRIGVGVAVVKVNAKAREVSFDIL